MRRTSSSAARLSRSSFSARAQNRRFGLFSAPRAHTKAPYKTDLHRKTLRALNRPGGPGRCIPFSLCALRTASSACEKGFYTRSVTV
jgi:hypothetical protein